MLNSKKQHISKEKHKTHLNLLVRQKGCTKAQAIHAASICKFLSIIDINSMLFEYEEAAL